MQTHNALSQAVHYLQCLSPQKTQEALDFIEFLYNKEQKSTANSSVNNEWDWLKQLQPFDDAFEQAIAQQPLAQQRDTLGELFE
jgi:hypothetical protein